MPTTIQLASWRVTSTVSPGPGTVNSVVVGEYALSPEGSGRTSELREKIRLLYEVDNRRRRLSLISTTICLLLIYFALKEATILFEFKYYLLNLNELHQNFGHFDNVCYIALGSR